LAPYLLRFGNTDADLDNFATWYSAKFLQSGETEEKLFLDQVMNSVQADMEDPKFHTQLQEIAAEVREVLENERPENVTGK
jgi:hypothetical protein